MATAAATCSSRSAAEAMRVQLWQTPQKEARDWPLDQMVAGLALALDGHGEHEGEGVFAGSGGAAEEERVGQAAGGDGGAEVLDGGGVAEEVVEGCG